MSDATAHILHGLTGPQRDAVLHTEGPLLVLAAAGSGKTRVITRRIAFLMSKGVPPWGILALTFTNKAAGEMRERVAHVLQDTGLASRWSERALRSLTVSTFHSLCARLLRRYAAQAGLSPEFTIFDDGDQMSLAKRVVGELQLSSSNWPPRSVLAAISDAKNQLLDADAYAVRAGDFYTKTIAKAYRGYEQGLKQANAVDFDDLLVKTALLLKKDAAVRAELQDRWRYILIDEYQDTNHAQFTIASLLAGEGHARKPSGSIPPGMEDEVAPSKGPNICVVGDPDQAIYGWRGADITNILDFERHYPSAAVIKLGENFRSTAPILAAADTLIKNNKRRKDKPLFTSKSGGERISVTHCRDEQHEATLVADWLDRAHRDGDDPVAWKDMAVFYRTNSLSRVMEDALRQAGVPYTIARGTAFYEREEVRNAIAYLRVVANTADVISLERIINVPARGVGDTSFERIALAANAAGTPVFRMMQSVEQVSGLTARAQGAVRKFVETVEGWTGGGTFMGSQVSSSLAELVERVIKESGLEQHYRKQADVSKSESDQERLDNLDELVSSARQFELEYDPAGDPAFSSGVADEAGSPETHTPPLLAMLRGFLESITLVADADAIDPANGAVTMMTLHAAKGLEFPVVAIVGLEEGLLPHSRSFDNEAQLEEERRLCFVGITRAMRRLHLSDAKYRTLRGRSERTIPSRFLSELPQSSVIVSDQSDVFAGLEDSGWGQRRVEQDDDVPQAWAEPKAPAGRRVVPDHSHESGSAASAFPVGAVVRHPQFGEGKIVSVSGGVNARAVVDFRGVGAKTLVLEYARLTRVR